MPKRHLLISSCEHHKEVGCYEFVYGRCYVCIVFRAFQIRYINTVKLCFMLAKISLAKKVSLSRTQAKRIISKLWLSSGENVTNTGTPNKIRSACVSNRINRRASCVPGNVREECSIFVTDDMLQETSLLPNALSLNRHSLFVVQKVCCRNPQCVHYLFGSFFELCWR